MNLDFVLNHQLLHSNCVKLHFCFSKKKRKTNLIPSFQAFNTEHWALYLHNHTFQLNIVLSVLVNFFLPVLFLYINLLTFVTYTSKFMLWPISLFFFCLVQMASIQFFILFSNSLQFLTIWSNLKCVLLNFWLHCSKHTKMAQFFSFHPLNVRKKKKLHNLHVNCA